MNLVRKPYKEKYIRKMSNVHIFDEFTYNGDEYVVLSYVGESVYSWKGCKYAEQLYKCVQRSNDNTESDEIILNSHQIRGLHINMPLFNFDTREITYIESTANEYTPLTVINYLKTKNLCK